VVFQEGRHFGVILTLVQLPQRQRRRVDDVQRKMSLAPDQFRGPHRHCIAEMLFAGAAKYKSDI
jgi:hypothetical protein